MMVRKVVLPSDCDRMPAAHFKSRTRVHAVVTPQGGRWQVPVQFLLEPHHVNVVKRNAAQHRARPKRSCDRQFVDEFPEPPGGSAVLRRKPSMMFRCRMALGWEKCG